MNNTPPKDFIDFIDFTPVKSVNPTRPTAEFSRRLYRHYTHTFRCVMGVNSSSALSEGRTADKRPPVKSSPQDARERPHKPLQPRQGKRTGEQRGHTTSERERLARDCGQGTVSRFFSSPCGRDRRYFSRHAFLPADARKVDGDQSTISALPR